MLIYTVLNIKQYIEFISLPLESNGSKLWFIKFGIFDRNEQITSK